MRDALTRLDGGARHRRVCWAAKFTKVEKRGWRPARRDQQGRVHRTATRSCSRSAAMPNTAALHVEKAGVELGKRGEVKVDDYSRTSGAAHLRHRRRHRPHPADAGRDPRSHVLCRDRFQEQSHHARSHPCAQRGVHHAGARRRRPDRDEGAAAWVTPSTSTNPPSSPLLHTLGGRPVRTHMKLIVDAKTDKVLGCHIFGDHAAEIIQVVAVCAEDGRHQKGFRQHHRAASHGRRGIGDDADEELQQDAGPRGSVTSCRRRDFGAGEPVHPRIGRRWYIGAQSLISTPLLVEFTTVAQSWTPQSWQDKAHPSGAGLSGQGGAGCASWRS